jgi:hypothetical protein
MPRRCHPKTNLAVLRLALEQEPEEVDIDMVIEHVAELVIGVRGLDGPV